MEKKKLLDRSSEIEVALVRRNPLLMTAAMTVATTGVVGVAKGPAKKAGAFVKGAAVNVFSGSKGETAASVVAEKASANLAEVAFKGGGSEEAVGLAGNGLVSLTRWLLGLVK